MNKIYVTLVFLWLSFNSYSQVPEIYIDFLSHNEENQPWDDKVYYSTNRTRLINLSNYFQSKGISWNLQSDWKFLLNVLNQDSIMISSTNGKNILKWMCEEKGVEIDPHAHESIYLYPDVVKLMDSVGLPVSKVIGGSIYNDKNGKNIWTNLQNGQFGIIFPKYFWQPDYLMGGGTPNHINDLNYYGFWNPKDPANYLIHEPTNHLRHIGVGCEMKIRDTTTINYFLNQIKELILNVQDGSYPSNGFYFQTIFFEQGDLNNSTFFNKVKTIADSINAIVSTGNLHWKTFKQAYSEWESSYNAQIFQWECGQIITNTSNATSEDDLLYVYPNPFKNILNIKNANGNEYFELFNSIGYPIWNGCTITQNDFRYLAPGLYILRVKEGSTNKFFKIYKI